ncbi:hypothetical protein [Schleiferilactobacillus perolens]|uniref:hypothetical protein n=1 Tax=Schleiferilactobacillus perolens TaxID=100468 RepID=UPI002355775A|nr:hypothetical protein [Schleiferilactobacillus perolens]MCI1892710.1 hypothetical protein [Schleiferilactobacillus harbinensis]MCI1913460.1 hypothetical protein [Schleiferilactobacillus harbinensis]MCI2171722.1 hypothetical protein [Schleiferilactobacillus perolens]
MTILLTALVVIYGCAMAAAAVMARHNVSRWLVLGTLLFSGCLLLGLYWYWLIPIGLIGLLGVAIGNGYALYGHVHWRNVLVRGAVSVIIQKQRGYPYFNGFAVSGGGIAELLT